MTIPPVQRMYHIKPIEIILGLLLALLTIFEAGVIYQIKALKSEQAIYIAKTNSSLSRANFRSLRTTATIALDYKYYDSYYLNQLQKNKPNISKYYKANFSDELITAIKRSTKKPFDEPYYTDMYDDPSQLFHDSEKWANLAAQADQQSNTCQLILLIAGLGSALIAWIASRFDENEKLRVFKSVPLPPSFPPF